MEEAVLRAIRTQRATGVMTTACRYKEIQRNTGNPSGEGALSPQPDLIIGHNFFQT